MGKVGAEEVNSFSTCIMHPQKVCAIKTFVVLGMFPLSHPLCSLAYHRWSSQVSNQLLWIYCRGSDNYSPENRIPVKVNITGSISEVNCVLKMPNY